MYGSASELRATLEYDFSQEKDFGDAKVDIQDEKVDIESVLSEKSSDFSVKTTVHNHRLFEKFGFDEVFGRSAVMELLELKSSGASKLLANLTQAEIIEPVSGHGKQGAVQNQKADNAFFGSGRAKIVIPGAALFGLEFQGRI